MSRANGGRLCMCLWRWAAAMHTTRGRSARRKRASRRGCTRCPGLSVSEWLRHRAACWTRGLREGNARSGITISQRRGVSTESGRRTRYSGVASFPDDSEPADAGGNRGRWWRVVICHSAGETLEHWRALPHRYVKSLNGVQIFRVMDGAWWRAAHLARSLTTISHRKASTRPRSAQPSCNLNVSASGKKVG